VVQPIASSVQVIQPLPDQTPAKMLSRMYQIGTFSWAVGAAASINAPAMILDPVNLLMIQPSVADIIQWYRYFNAGVEVHFRLNTNQFYAGALAITAVPRGTLITDTNQQCRSWLGHKVLSAAKQDTIVLNLPWAHPYRFKNIDDVIVGGDTMWVVYLDILSPLIASVSAPSAIDVTIFARFQDPKLYLPFEETAPIMKGFKNIKKQSGQGSVMSTSIRPKRSSRSVVHVSQSSSDPVASAASPPSPSPLSTIGTILTPITDIAQSVGSVLSAAQPILDVLGGLFDKPEIAQPITRVYPTTAANVSTVDQPDQSLPLSMYSGSYLNIDHSALPGGRAWTMADIAMTPSLHFQYKFTVAGDTVSIPFLALGTPFQIIAGTHQFWRGSVRLHIKFFCPAFVSGRILFIIGPSGLPVANTVANNLSRVVDVKGDTTESFTLPFVFPTDYCQSDDIPYTIQASVLSQIVTNDTTIPPSIDMVIYSAAAPDCQFSLLVPPQPSQYAYPNVVAPPKSKVRRQSDISKEFAVTFNPFVMDCEMLTDQHHVTSETTMYATDVLKRYINTPAPTLTNNMGVFPGEYSPVKSTPQYLFSRMFLAHRGGMRLKMITTDNPILVASVYGSYAATWNGALNGTPSLVSTPTNSVELSISCPWYYSVPWRWFDSQLTIGPLPPVSIYYGGANPDEFLTFTAVRDDYIMGFLIPPDNIL